DAKIPGITGSAPYISGQAMLRAGPSMSGVMLRGVLPEQEASVSDVGSSMVAGAFDALQPGKYRIVIGKDLAFVLGVNAGDHVDLMVPSATVTPAGVMP